MRLHLCVVGRLRGGPQAALVDEYLARFARTGRGIGFAPVALREIDDRGSCDEQAARLLRALPSGPLCVLDERGIQMASPRFAHMIAGWRDDGQQDAALVIGGADGLDPALRSRADVVLSLGPMVWPHMLVRVMLAEQLYRAASILAGHPYHRA